MHTYVIQTIYEYRQLYRKNEARYRDIASRIKLCVLQLQKEPATRWLWLFHNMYAQWCFIYGRRADEYFAVKWGAINQDDFAFFMLYDSLKEILKNHYLHDGEYVAIPHYIIDILNHE